MPKLKLQYFGHLMGRTDSLEKTLMLGKIEGRSRRTRQRIRWLDGITESMESLSQWIWVWASPRSWWWPRHPQAISVIVLCLTKSVIGHGRFKSLPLSLLAFSRVWSIPYSPFKAIQNFLDEKGRGSVDASGARTENGQKDHDQDCKMEILF